MKTLILGTAVLIAGVAHDAVAADDAYQAYRRAMVGDSSVAAPATPAAPTGYGPYALYLMHQGASPHEALARARAVGEQPPAPQAPAAQATLTGYDLYRRAVLGQDVHPGTAPAVVASRNGNAALR